MASGDPLKAFLLGPRPVIGDKRPWSRFYLTAMRDARDWTSIAGACHACQQPGLTAIQVGLDPHDVVGAFRLILCLRCGASVISFWGEGEYGSLLLDPEAWDDPPQALQEIVSALSQEDQEGSLG